MEPIPITLLSGWLGSGKTTLLNAILAGAGGRRIAVLQNEFGDIGLDGDLIEGSVAALYELSAGCICCSVHDDFMAVLEELITLDPPPESIVVETTGVADPSVPLVSILQHPAWADAFELDGVITMVDVENALDSLREFPEVALQVAAADLLLLSRCDRADSSQVDRVRSAIGRINPEGRIIRCDLGRVDGVDLLDIGGFDPSRLAIRSGGEPDRPAGGLHPFGISTVSFRSDRPMNFDRFERGLGEIFDRWGDGLLRAKGIIRVEGVERPLLLQGVRRRYSWQYAPGSPVDHSRLVMIGRDLDEEGIVRILREGISPVETDPESDIESTANRNRPEKGEEENGYGKH